MGEILDGMLALIEKYDGQMGGSCRLMTEEEVEKAEKEAEALFDLEDNK